MKIAVCLCFILLCAGVLRADDAELAGQKRDRQAQYINRFQAAYRAYLGGDTATARKFIKEAEEILPGTAALANFRGGILFDKRNYAEATTWFEDALKRDPNFYPAKVNLADISFRNGEYAKARTAYRVLLSEQKGNESLLYRIFLTYLMENDDEAAKTALDAIPFPGDTPAYYFANGAWCYKHGNERDALGWIEPGMSIFGYERSAVFVDPLAALGWMKANFRPPPNTPLANPPISLDTR